MVIRSRRSCGRAADVGHAAHRQQHLPEFDSRAPRVEPAQYGVIPANDRAPGASSRLWLSATVGADWTSAARYWNWPPTAATSANTFAHAAAGGCCRRAVAAAIMARWCRACVLGAVAAGTSDAGGNTTATAASRQPATGTNTEWQA